MQRLEAAERLDAQIPAIRVRITMLRALIAPTLGPTIALEVFMLYGEGSYHAGAPGRGEI